MWRTTTAAMMWLFLIAVPAVAEEAPCSQSPLSRGDGLPFGFFDGNPAGKTSASGLFPLFGWALAEEGILAVDLVVDGAVIQRADYGRRRPDVAKLYPGLPDSDAAGFGILMDTTQFLNGNHEVTMQVTSVNGVSRKLNSYTINFQNTTHTLRPFGDIDFPQQSAELFGNCDLTDPDRRFSVITGWTLDAGLEINDHGVAYVELLLDGGLLLSSRRSCRHSVATGAFTDCYGLRRADVQRRFPQLKDAPNSGFRFVLDVGLLIAPIPEGGVGYRPGHHTLTIRVGDIDSQVSNVDTVNVTFFCDDFVGNQGSFGQISTPLNDQHAGLVDVTGWALDWEGVDAVFIWVDGKFIGTAAFGFPRPDITSLYPGFPDSARPGWGYGLSTILFSDGEHELTAVVRDETGIDTIIGEVRFTVNNGTPP